MSHSFRSLSISLPSSTNNSAKTLRRSLSSVISEYSLPLSGMAQFRSSKRNVKEQGEAILCHSLPVRNCQVCLNQVLRERLIPNHAGFLSTRSTYIYRAARGIILPALGESYSSSCDTGSKCRYIRIAKMKRNVYLKQGYLSQLSRKREFNQLMGKSSSFTSFSCEKKASLHALRKRTLVIVSCKIDEPAQGRGKEHGLIELRLHLPSKVMWRLLEILILELITNRLSVIHFSLSQLIKLLEFLH